MGRTYPCRLKIYLLENDVDENKYAGSTTKTKKKRMQIHHYDYMRRPKTSTLHKHIQEIGWSHFSMKVIDEFDCPDERYAGEAENTAIQIWGNLNHNLAWVDPKERKERHDETTKAWYNTLPVSQCDFCGGCWKTEAHKDHHEKTQKHIAGVAAFDVESHRLAKEVLGMYL